MDPWLIAILTYSAIALLTLLPTLKVILSKIALHDGGAGFDDSSFSEDAKKRLIDHYSRLQGTLGFWKKRATIYTSFHYYSVFWTILSAWAVPLIGSIAPQTEGSYSKWLIVLISSHVALALSFHRGLKVSEGMKAFRHGESEFYDLYRRLLDRPHVLGDDETKQVDSHFSEVERIRRLVRTAETESVPNVESIRPIDESTS